MCRYCLRLSSEHFYLQKNDRACTFHYVLFARRAPLHAPLTRPHFPFQSREGGKKKEKKKKAAFIGVGEIYVHAVRSSMLEECASMFLG